MKSKTAIVTGASSGIGEATAERLAAAGYRVFGTSRRAASAGQRSFEMVTLDVTSDQSVEAAVREVMRRADRIDVLVNNAGFGVAPAGAEESSIGQAQSIFDTNFFGDRPDDARRRTRDATARSGDASSTSARYWASCPCRTGRSMPRPSTRSKAIRSHSTMNCAHWASACRSSSPRTRGRRSTRTSSNPMPRSRNIARFVRR